MVLTDTEVLELFAEAERVIKAVAKSNEKKTMQGKTPVNPLLKLSENSTLGINGEIVKDINAVTDRVVDDIDAAIDYVKDLRMRIRQIDADLQFDDKDKKK